MHDLGNPLHAETVRGAQDTSTAYGYVLLLADAQELAINEAAYGELLASRRIDGALLHLSGQPLDESLQNLTNQRLPTVVINSQIQTAAGSIILQDEEAAVLATEHLLELGHTKLGFLRALSQSPQGSRRLRGVKRTLSRAGLDLSTQWAPEAGFDVAGGALAMQKLLAEPSRPTGVVVANVMAAIGALSSTRAAGVRIPEDMSLVAIHDTWMASHTAPPLTTVRLPLYELGAVAVDILVDVLDNRKRKDAIISNPPPQLVRRASSAPLN
jgi:LacI family transcriptional regulator